MNVTRDDQQRIARAIAAAQDGTTGQIAVRIVPDRSVDAFERAKREFQLTGLHEHAPENAALVLVAPEAKQFAVIGDRALHERVGDEFWQRVVSDAQPHFERGAVADGAIEAVGRIGDALREHFPAEPAS